MQVQRNNQSNKELLNVVIVLFWEPLKFLCFMLHLYGSDFSCQHFYNAYHTRMLRLYLCLLFNFTMQSDQVKAQDHLDRVEKKRVMFSHSCFKISHSHDMKVSSYPCNLNVIWYVLQKCSYNTYEMYKLNVSEVCNNVKCQHFCQTWSDILPVPEENNYNAL